MDGEDSQSAAIESKRTFFRWAFKALSFNGISGDYAEFGSFGGVTFALAHEQIARRKPILGRPPTDCHMWSFDSFAGLPEPVTPTDEHPLWHEGMFAIGVDAFHEKCAENGLPRHAYTVVPGFYDESLGAASTDDQPTDIAFAYVDCDMYSSTKAVLEYLRVRLKHGMILAFDDYFCFSSQYPSGEKMAFEEMVAAETRWRFEPYRDFGWAGRAFVVEGPLPFS